MRIKTFALLAITLFLLSGCNSIKKNFISKIGFERVVSISGSPLEALTISAEFRNDTKHPIKILRGQATVYLDGSNIATATLAQEVVIPSKATSIVPCPFIMNVVNPLKGVLLIARIKRKAYDGITIDYTADIKFCGISKTLSGKNTPISQLVPQTQLTANTQH